MKFDKFVKRSGTHGSIVQSKDGDKWLICGDVAMVIPAGVNVLATEISEGKPMFEAIIHANTEDDVLELVRATIPADGKVKDIVRIFATEDGENEIQIRNENFGLIEKADRLVYLQIDDDVEEHEFILITDRKGETVLGFIRGNNF